MFEVVQEFEENGEKWDEVYDEDTYYVIPDANGEINYDFYFIISPEDLKDGKDIRLDITDLNNMPSGDESGESDKYTVSIPLIFTPSNNSDSSDDNASSDDVSSSNSSSGGCDTGVLSGALIALALLGVAVFRVIRIHSSNLAWLERA